MLITTTLQQVNLTQTVTNTPNPYCPVGFTTIGSISGAAIQTATESSWTTFSFTFTAPSNTNGMIIGGNCLTDDNYFIYVDDVSVTTNCTGSTIPSSATATVVCPGASYSLSRSGGSLGTGASWKWYSGSCGGTLVGTGSTITVNPSSTTTYYVRAEGSCNTTSCQSVTVTIASSTGTYTWDGSSSTDWHEPCNWNRNKVPTSASDVIIPGGTARNPSINAGQTGNCNSIQVNYSNGGSLSINTAAGARLNVNH